MAVPDSRHVSGGITKITFFDVSSTFTYNCARYRKRILFAEVAV